MKENASGCGKYIVRAASELLFRIQLLTSTDVLHNLSGLSTVKQHSHTHTNTFKKIKKKLKIKVLVAEQNVRKKSAFMKQNQRDCHFRHEFSWHTPTTDGPKGLYLFLIRKNNKFMIFIFNLCVDRISSMRRNHDINEFYYLFGYLFDVHALR